MCAGEEGPAEEIVGASAARGYLKRLEGWGGGRAKEGIGALKGHLCVELRGERNA